MRFAMSTPEALRTAARLLRDAGYEDASKTSRPAGDPQHVLSVTIDGVGCRIQVEWIVYGVDPAAESSGADGQGALPDRGGAAPTY
jgi:hypothetical protein